MNQIFYIFTSAIIFDLLLQPPPNFHSMISFDSSDTWLSPSQGFSFSTTTFSLGSIRASSFAKKSGLLRKREKIRTEEMRKTTKTSPGYPPLLLLQASHPVQVHHLLHLCSGSWSSSFAFLPIWPFSLGLDFGWKLGRQFLVSALEPFSPQAFLASSFSTLYQGLLKDFAARLSQQDSPPRLHQFVLHTHPQHLCLHWQSDHPCFHQPVYSISGWREVNE